MPQLIRIVFYVRNKSPSPESRVQTQEDECEGAVVFAILEPPQTDQDGNRPSQLFLDSRNRNHKGQNTEHLFRLR